MDFKLIESLPIDDAGVSSQNKTINGEIIKLSQVLLLSQKLISVNK